MSKLLFVTGNGRRLPLIRMSCSLWRAFFCFICASSYFSLLHCFCEGRIVKLRKVFLQMRNVIKILKGFDVKKNVTLL